MKCLVCRKKLRETPYRTMSTSKLPKKYADMVSKHVPEFYRCYSCSKSSDSCYLVFPDGKIFIWDSKKAFRWYLVKDTILEKVIFT